LPFKRFDLIHAFNRLPIGKTPFIINFESHLPRAFGHENSAQYKYMTDMLVSDRCKGIIAISEYARKTFLNQHEGNNAYDVLKDKVIVRYPNMVLPEDQDAFTWKDGEAFRLVFLGAHFGRKGGMVAVRIAQLAKEKNIPIQLDIISGMETGAASWVDPLRDNFFNDTFRIIKEMPNIHHHGSLPNAQVQQLLKGAHFTLLPTFSDSFGFSVVESMAHFTPVIVTKQCALPEFVEDNQNGVLLPLELNEGGEWIHIAKHDRSTPAYEKLFLEETERLAQKAIERIAYYMNNKDAYLKMRLNARNTAEKFFDAKDANKFWNGYYRNAMEKV